MIKLGLISFFILCQSNIGLSNFAFAGQEQLKYGPTSAPRAIPLAQSNDYFRNPKNLAPAFWALISYYIPQTTGASCASATLAMTLNAARAGQVKKSSEKVITEKLLWEKVKSRDWNSPSNSKDYRGEHGLTLDQVGKITETAFKEFGFNHSEIKVVHFSQSNLQKSELVKDLKSLSGQNFILANFNQKVFTDDAEIGHFAPIGAYDAKNNRVLVLDPDRGSENNDGYYEPYWVSLSTFMEGMTTLDSELKTYRGYILVKAKK